jgi:hypothetical protein
MIDTSNSFGIDKIVLKTRDFQVNKAELSGLTVQPASIDLSTGEDQNVPLFTDKYGQRISGHKAYLNTELHQTTVDRWGYVTVQFSPLKAVHGYHVASTDEVLQDRIKTVLNDLANHGINANWHESSLHRIDVARNVFMSDPVSTYGNVYSWINAKRSKRQTQYPDGFSTGNDSYGVIFYNKGLESKEYQADGYVPYLKDNLLRGELQFKRSKSIQSVFGCKTLDHIRQSGIILFQNEYRTVMQDRIFREKTFSGQLSFSFTDHVTVLKELREKYPRSAINLFLQIISVPAVMQTYGSIDNLKKVFEQAGFKRNAVYKNIQKFSKLLKVYNQLHKSEDQILVKKYHELQYKLTA